MTSLLFCIALTVFTEAKGEPFLGQQAVASVVVNRAKIRKKDTCAVILEKGQFPWGPEKRIEAKNRTYSYSDKGLPIRSEAWRQAVRAAKMAIFSDNSMKNIEFFHSVRENPSWKRRYFRVFRAGNHVFYARNQAILGRKLG